MFGAEDGSGLFGSGILFIFYLAILVLLIAGMWKTFEKAGKPGWAAIIPIYNVIVLCQVAGRPGWWVILFLIPIVNVIIQIIVSIDVAKRFAHGAGYGILLWLFPFVMFLVIGFGSDTYQEA